MVKRLQLWVQLIEMMEVQLTEMDAALLEQLRQDGRAVVDHQLRQIFVSKYAEMAFISLHQVYIETMET
jgi:hypothetical protein